MKKAIVSLSIILLGILGFSQEDSAKDSLKVGNSFYKNGYYKKALVPLLFALEYNKEDADLNYKIGHSYLNSPIKTKARPYLQKAYDLNHKVDEDVVFELARAYHYEENWDKAEEHYRESVEAGNRNIEDYIAQCEYGKILSADPINVTIEDLGEEINSSFGDYAAVVTSDGKNIYYTSRRPGTTGGKLDYTVDVYMEDIYHSEKDDNGNWKPATNVGTPINSDVHDATVNISGDGQTLFIYRSENENGGDLYISKLNGDVWSTPESLGDNINTKYSDLAASLSPDGNTLYFVTNKPGGEGGKDIYVSKMQEDNIWGAAENIGAIINTKGDEDGVFMHADGKTLYFSSTGHKTMGGYDIFKSELTDGVWGTPENIGFPVNTPDEDVFFVMTADGKEGYYSSGKIGGVGEKDLYKITFHDADKNLTLFSGVITNETGDKLPGDIEVTIMKSGVLFNTLKSNSKTGEFTFTLPNGEDYEVVVKFNDLIPFKEEVLLKDQVGYQEVNKDIVLMDGNKNQALDYVYTIQVVAYLNKTEAQNVLKIAKDNGVEDAYLQKVVFTDRDEQVYRVRIGRYDTLEEGQIAGDKLPKVVLVDNGIFWVDNVREDDYYVAKKEYDILEE
jgi:tetratricopeptide (TPR) repeat protein